MIIDFKLSFDHIRHLSYRCMHIWKGYVHVWGKQMHLNCFIYCSYVLQTKLLQQWTHTPVNNHADIVFNAMQSNCSGDLVLTILWFCVSSCFTVFDESEPLYSAARFTVSVYEHKWNRECWHTLVWRSRIIECTLDPGRRKEREGEREGPRQAALALFTTKSHCLMWSRSRLQSSCSHRMCSG